MAANLELIIKAKDEASAVLGNVDKKASGLSGTLGTGMKLAGAAAAVGIGAAVVAGIDFVKQAAEEQEGIAKLGAAVDANGGNWAANRAEIEKVIASRQRLAFSDDEQRDSLAFLVAQTGDVNEALSRQRTAMDLARGSGLDLASASKLLGKVTDESHAALGRLGIVVDKNASSQEVLAAVQQRFGGQAEAFAGTATAKWQRFNIALDNIKESIGSALLPIVTKLGEKLSIFLEEHQEDIDKAVASWTEFANSEVWPTLEAAFTQLTQLIQGIMDTGIIQWITEHKEAMIALGVALLALALAFGGPIIVIPALIAAGTLLLANWDAITDKIDEIVTDFQEKFPLLVQIIEFVFSLIKARVDFWITEVKAVIDIVMALIHGDFDAAWQGIKDLINGFLVLIKTDVQTIIGQLPGIILGLDAMIAAAALTLGQNMATAAYNGFITLLGKIVSWLTGLPGALLGALPNLGKLFFSIGQQIGQGLLDGIKDAAKGLLDINLNPTGIDVPGVDVLGFQKGTGYVPSTGLALLHRGEMVIPAERNPLVHGMGAAGGMTLVYAPTYSQATPAEAQRFAIWVKQALRA